MKQGFYFLLIWFPFSRFFFSRHVEELHQKREEATQKKKKKPTTDDRLLAPPEKQTIGID
jgi:hypothetical protein